jgi:hypothetical protein
MFVVDVVGCYNCSFVFTNFFNVDGMLIFAVLFVDEKLETKKQTTKKNRI